MIIGVVKEIKDQERRVALTPEGASLLARHGHTVQVESGAGAGSGFADPAYQAAGAKIVDTAHAWDTELVLKVKEPQPSEFPYLRRNFLFTYLHLAGVPAELTRALLAAHTVHVADARDEFEERHHGHVAVERRAFRQEADAALDRHRFALDVVA